jgi:hypothetical protein
MRLPSRCTLADIHPTGVEKSKGKPAPVCSEPRLTNWSWSLAGRKIMAKERGSKTKKHFHFSRLHAKFIIIHIIIIELVALFLLVADIVQLVIFKWQKVMV